jgi:hypothetical protein
MAGAYFKIWTETVGAYFKVVFRHSPGNTEGMTNNITW